MSDHSALAKVSREEHNKDRENAAKIWNQVASGRLLRADISIDMALQASIPVVPVGAMNDFFVQKQAVNVNILAS